MFHAPRGPGWGRDGGNWGTVLHTKSLIVLQILLFGKISITKSSCSGQSGVPESQSQRKHGLRNGNQQCRSLQVKPGSGIGAPMGSQAGSWPLMPRAASLSLALWGPGKGQALGLEKLFHRQMGAGDQSSSEPPAKPWPWGPACGGASPHAGSTGRLRDLQILWAPFLSLRNMH